MSFFNNYTITIIQLQINKKSLNIIIFKVKIFLINRLFDYFSIL